MARLEEIAHDRSCQVGCEAVGEGLEVVSWALDSMIANNGVAISKNKE